MLAITPKGRVSNHIKGITLPCSSSRTNSVKIITTTSVLMAKARMLSGDMAVVKALNNRAHSGRKTTQGQIPSILPMAGETWALLRSDLTTTLPKTKGLIKLSKSPAIRIRAAQKSFRTL